MFICVVQKYAVCKYITINKLFQLGVKIISTHTGRDSFYGRHFELVGLVTKQLRSSFVEGKIFYFPKFNTYINIKFSTLNTPKLLKLFFELNVMYRTQQSVCPVSIRYCNP